MLRSSALSAGVLVCCVALGSTSMSISLEKRVIRQSSAALHKSAYFGSVTVGEPAQAFTAVFDTGSGNLIIPGSKCHGEACLKHTRFDEEHSPNARRVKCDGSDNEDEPDQLTITFGTGKITGRCLVDKICIGNACTVGTFMASTDESTQPFAEFQFDGVLGLALPSMAQGPTFSMMQRLVNAEALKQPLFSVFLSNSDEETSEITFGEIKDDHMASDLFWVPVSGDAGYWEVNIDDIIVGGESQGVTSRVAVDTGTSELAGPTSLINELRDTLQVNEDCSNYAELPKLGFAIGGRVLTLAPKDYVENTDGRCDVALMNLDVPPPKGPLFVFGIPFLQKYYTVYDHMNKRVGFAVAKHNGEAAEMLVEVDPPASKYSGFLAKNQVRSSWRRPGFLRALHLVD